MFPLEIANNYYWYPSGLVRTCGRRFLYFTQGTVRLYCRLPRGGAPGCGLLAWNLRGGNMQPADTSGISFLKLISKRTDKGRRQEQPEETEPKTAPPSLLGRGAAHPAAEAILTAPV